MYSFTSGVPGFAVSSLAFADLKFHSISHVFFRSPPKKRAQKHPKTGSSNFVAVRDYRSLLDFSCFGKTYELWGCSGVGRRCKVSDSEGDFELEAEIMEFMKNSKKPEVFPSKKELIDAGRIDLVEKIMHKGGWLCLGWDLDEKEGTKSQDDGLSNWDLTIKNAENSAQERIAFEGNDCSCSEMASSVSAHSSQSTSSSGRSLEMPLEDASGIEGILNRLEKERNTSLGFDLENSAQSRCNINKVAGLNSSSKCASLSPKNANGVGGKIKQEKPAPDVNIFKSPMKPDAWRTWSNQRAGVTYTEFEAAEFSIGDTGLGERMDRLQNYARVCTSGLLNGREEFDTFNGKINLYQIQTRIQQLESELSSVLVTLRCNNNDVLSKEGDQGSAEDLQHFSDALEFQENEIMSARDRLRSIRAKVAVLEGKMALAVIDAQKMADEKQRRVDDAHRSLQLLRTMCIIWPNLASEVLLAGSFDGWATQRKMEKSSTGVFSLRMKLYPGKYEIKFIVDGEWKVDPLRPIVNSSGYENNLLIIT